MRHGSSVTGSQGMQHLNGDLLCAIDCETTGLIAGEHDLIEIAVLPLGADLEPLKTIPPFVCLIKPKRPQNVDPIAMKVNNITIDTTFFDPWDAADLFDQWFQNLGLAPRKQIAPLAHNWPFDRSFILDWLGQETFGQLFSRRYRDTMVMALFADDRACFQIGQLPFSKVDLTYCLSSIGLHRDRAHRALDDAAATAQLWKHAMTMFMR